ncbi:hypothetical protein [Actinomadura sp. 6N118]|uniref:hypothetical protein n=1 Tax=Actinomadura sp. 6N118 TaxID=3375151 RepID=UPI0037B0E8C3
MTNAAPAQIVFSAEEELDLRSLNSNFTLQADEGTVAAIGGLFERVAREAPRKSGPAVAEG